MFNNLDEKKLFKGIGAILLYFFATILLQIPFIFFTENQYIILLVPYTIVLITFILLYKKDLKKDLKDFKKNYKKILLTTFKYWLIGFIIMIALSFIINLLPIKEVLNQEDNKNLLNTYPLIEIAIAVIIAPIAEEIAFRLSFRKFTKNKWAFALTTGLLFGFIHILSSLIQYGNPLYLIYLLPYGTLGTVFGLAYAKTDNIYGTMTFHALHNVLSILELLIIGGVIL